MLQKFFNLRPHIPICVLVCSIIFMLSGCSTASEVESIPVAQKNELKNSAENSVSPQNLTENSLQRGRIEVKPDSPASAVQTFYAHLREGRYREALTMTNLRPAIATMTDAEMKEYESDFAALSRQVPPEIQISGEIVTNDKAGVTARFLNEETGKPEDKVLNLRRENGNWIFLTADEKTEADVKKQGKNYFRNLRIEIHHIEAQDMLERIAKAQTVYAMENQAFTDMQTLVTKGLLPEDAQNSASTGYKYKITVTADNKSYFATADPETYGKTGKFSYLMETASLDEKARLSGKDNKGMSLKN